MFHLGPKRPPSRKGSMADVPRNLMDELAKYQELLTVSPQKLKKITDHFISELEKGLSVKGGNIPMIPTWIVDYPTGEETGEYLAIDLGGTNLRVVLVKLLGNCKFDTEQSKYHLPSDIRTTRDKDILFSYIADSVAKFINDLYPNGVPKGKILPLGFTFSYPCTQSRIDTGVLQRWTKGFDIPGVEGYDVVPMLVSQFEKRKVPVKLVALINDTSGTLVASRYTDPATEMGLIFGTGCNGAYYDRIHNIPKLAGKLQDDITQDSPMLINCEYGSFDNEHLALPRTKYDIIIDAQSPRPNQQAFEKMIAGYYLGEVLRLILVELYEKNLILEKYKSDNEGIKLLNEPYILDTEVLTRIEDDPFENLEDTCTLFKEKLHLEFTSPERKLIRKLAELIGTRAARLSICGIAAVTKKMNYLKCHCAADGSVFNHYTNFPARAVDGLADIFDWKLQGLKPEDYPIQIVPSEDGSGVGAAVAAALTHRRIEKGLSVGLKGA
ncbi:hypothetical protein PACTADRAFT_37405 [Pachysolen tannophilus NRRL Y-2460]|uniref:Phosphotransferase n=1 Tax=Pachysolen tannophilus NRRL Y-2460 TaxID=669874 RepID=A0A1E4U2K2_PACTA|nr:hypothetical protein PACTADRAFT_37405 [Pachysolen tannophilus NRRL Y-2460]